MSPTCVHRRAVADEHGDVASTVSTARAVLSSVSAGLPRPPLAAPVGAGEVFGSWTSGQDAFLDALVSMDAIRAISESVPQSLRSFLA